MNLLMILPEHLVTNSMCWILYSLKHQSGNISYQKALMNLPVVNAQILRIFYIHVLKCFNKDSKSKWKNRLKNRTFHWSYVIKNHQAGRTLVFICTFGTFFYIFSIWNAALKALFHLSVLHNAKFIVDSNSVIVTFKMTVFHGLFLSQESCA